MSPGGPSGGGEEGAGNVFVAEEVADVVEAFEVAHAAEEQLGDVVGEDGLGLASVEGVDLGDRLPDSDELHADPRNSRRPLR